MRWLRPMLGALLPALLLGAPVHAQKSADTLRISWVGGVPNVDPYYNQQRVGLVLAHHAFDGLVQRDPETFAIKPLLATSWRYVDDTTLDFDLRRNVTFHDGSPFSADDVVYTFNTILTDRSVAVPSNFLWLAGAEKLDDFKVRVKLKRVFPAALEYIATVLPIWPKAYRERVGVDAYAKLPVGAGPYRFTKVDGDAQVDMERYDGYYANSPKGQPQIRRLVMRTVGEPAALTAEVLGNRADWVWQVAPDAFDHLAHVPFLTGVREESMRIGYLSLDAAGRTGADNPLTNLKVRQAIFHAIDRPTIARNLIPGGSRVPDGPCYPTQFGCDAAAAIRYDYDPTKARALLAEAGYPNGVQTELVSYVQPAITAAIQGYLKAVGIDAAVSQVQTATSIQRAQEGRSPLDLGTWGSYSINDVSAILPNFFTFTNADYARDLELKALIEQGGNNIEPDVRRKFYSAAIKLITEKAYWLPLHTYVTTYVYRRGLAFKPFPDEMPRFYLSSWK